MPDKIELTEGQTRLVSSAKYLYKRWSNTPIHEADINDKLAYDKLIWLVHNFDFEAFDEDQPCEVFEIPAGPISETYLHSRGERIITYPRQVS